MSPSQPIEDYKSLRFALRNGVLIRVFSAICVTIIIGIIAFQINNYLLYGVAAILGLALNFVLKVALDVLALVAETLLPQ